MTFSQADRHRWPKAPWRAVAVAAIVAASVTLITLVAAGGRPSPQRQEQPVSAAAPGPRTGPPQAGVGVGYPHSTAGAVAAAASYVEAFDGLDGARARGWARAVAAPASAGALVEQVSRGVVAIRVAAGLATSGPAPGSFVTYRVAAYQVWSAAPDRVVVWLLARESASAAGSTPVEQAAAVGLPVVWTRAGWRLTAQSVGRPPAAESPGSPLAASHGWRTLAPLATTPAGRMGAASTPGLPAPASLVTASNLDCGSGVAGLVCNGQRLVAAGLTALTHPAVAIGGMVGGLAGGAFAAVARDFGQSATALLHQLAGVFVTASTIQLSGAGLDHLVSVTVPIAAVVAAVLVIASAGSTAWRQDGSPLATALLGLARAGLVCVALVAVVQVCLRASDEVSSWIVTASFGSQTALRDRLGATLTAIDVVSPGLLLLVAGIAIALVLLLWAEMLLRHVAVVLLVATSPIAAAGLVCAATASWWPRARSALVQLIVLKPVVVLCLAIGFGEFGAARDVNSVVAGLVTLAAAAFAWPMLARFMTFSTAGAGSGLAASVGAGLGGLALGELRPALSGPGDRPGSGYPVAAERQNDAVMGVAQAAGSSSAAAGAGILAAQAVGTLAHTVGSGIDAMATHADLSTGPELAPGDDAGWSWEGER